ncbi:MAG: alpha/beta hydrolase, partial [Pseudomonadota bacterium]
VHGLKPYIIDMAAQYPKITVPVEILFGDLDEIVPVVTHGIPLSQQIEGANLTILEGIGHMPQHSAPEEALAAIGRAASRAGLR